MRDQWAKEIEKLFGIVPGIIGSGEFDVDHHPIVVGNVQSITLNVDRIEKVFGTVIMDECHHVPATTFTNVLDKLHARYRIGLSGTLQRKDGKHVMFPDFFGKLVLKPPQSNTLNPTIHILKTKIPLPADSSWAGKVTKLLADPEYTSFIASMALIEANKGYKVLVIADRVEFLKNVAELCQNRAALVLGETEDRDSELSKIADGSADILCGSRQIFSEGISQNELSCLILATPIVNTPTLEQLIGRVMRKSEGKKDPIVIDINFYGGTVKVQNEKRLMFYMEKGWGIKYL